MRASVDISCIMRAFDDHHYFQGMYTCHVTNEIGNSECSFEVTEEILAGGVMDLVIIFIVSIIVVMIIVVIIAVLCYLCWRRSQQDPDLVGRKKR